MRNALAVAVSGDQVWVANGLYQPTRDGDRSLSFVLVDGVDVYGGFAGGETSLIERNPVLNETILSGDLGGNDGIGSFSDNSCHVVLAAAGRLDGFTITGGNSDGSDGTIASGSAILRAGSFAGLRIVACAIRGNHGRAVDLTEASVHIVDCRFEDNVGGALGLWATDGLNRIRRCVFTGNSAASGSAIVMVLAFDTFIEDCLFFENVTDDGTITVGLESYPWISGCTVANNTSTTNTGAGVSGSFRGFGGIFGSVLYFNTGADASQGLDDQVVAGFPFESSCVQGGPTASGNIAVDPQFADAPAGDFHLLPTSPCIDAGSSVGYSFASLRAFDLDRAPRRQDVVEMGDTGPGASPVVDMGAYEFSGHLYSIVCAGDGSLATACPCGNSGDDGRGCRNTAVSSGAALVASGTPHPDTVVLTTNGAPPSVLCVFLQGNVLLPAGAVFGDGIRCVGGAIKRLGTKTTSAAGTASYPTVGDTRIAARSAALGDPIPNGATRWYQTWYRDSSATFCPPPTGATWNISAGIAIGW